MCRLSLYTRVRSVGVSATTKTEHGGRRSGSSRTLGILTDTSDDFDGRVQGWSDCVWCNLLIGRVPTPTGDRPFGNQYYWFQFRSLEV